MRRPFDAGAARSCHSRREEVHEPARAGATASSDTLGEGVFCVAPFIIAWFLVALGAFAWSVRRRDAGRPEDGDDPGDRDGA